MVVSWALDMKIYGHPRFCKTDFDLWWAYLNLSGVNVDKDVRASISSAPDIPKKAIGFSEPFFMLGFYQVVKPFMSSIISLRKTRWVTY